MLTQKVKNYAAIWRQSFAIIQIGWMTLGLRQALPSQTTSAPQNSDSASFTPYVWANEYGVSTKNSNIPEPAKAGFELFKKLEGQWIGRSTKGWEETITFKTIAKGSVVVENSFDAHPNETMMTMFHLDGQRLLLTHYCVAGNQPRLVATAFDDDGRTITFTFLDATNLPSRDQGHMDKAVFRFADDHHFSSQWTWYQEGKERWMEEIKYERKP